MKKRRELDALVTNGKLPRRKSKSGHELLRSNDDSDSSEVEEFSVPIGKASGRKWTGICPCSSCVALFVFIVMTSCLIACGGLIWMHFELKRDLDNLRDRLLKVESRNQGTPEEFQKFHGQLQALNKSVHEMRAGSTGLDTLAKNITNINKQMANLSAATVGLKTSLKAAPFLLDLPKKFETLTNTAAGFGSDMTTAKSDIQTLIEFRTSTLKELTDLKKRVEDMEKSSTDAGNHITAAPRGREQGGVVVSGDSNLISVRDKLKLLTALTESINTLNSTVSSKMSTINNSLLAHETRLGLLENFTSHLQQGSLAQKQKEHTDVTNGDGDGQDDMLKQLLSSHSPSEDDLSALVTIQGKVDNITALVSGLVKMYGKLKSDISSMNASSSAVSTFAPEDYEMFQIQTNSNFEYLNSTVEKMEEAVNQLTVNFVKNTNSLHNITAHMQGILQYLAAGGKQAEVSSDKTTPKPDVSSTASSVQVPEEKLSPSTQATMQTKSAAAIEIPNVKNMEDLDTFFNRWDRNGEGQVDPEDLPDFLGPKAPSPEELKPFDADNNGKYSIKEFAVALGLAQPESENDMKKVFQ